MSKDNGAILEFLFAGPLFSIFKVLNEIRREFMGLRETLTTFNNRLDAVVQGQASITGELRSDFDRLLAALAAAETPVSDDVSDITDSLGEKITALEGGVTALQGLDQPNPVEAPTGPGTVVDPGTFNPEPDPGQPQSPGEPAPVEVPESEQPTPVQPSDPEAPVEETPVSEPETPVSQDDSGLPEGS